MKNNWIGKIKTPKSNKPNHFEIYRSLRTRILFKKRDAKIISIVSNDIGDGKTDLAFSLAESYAKTGLKVLLIDGNLRNPKLSSELKFRENDLSSLLRRSAKIETGTIQTDIKNLFILPTKRAENESTELLTGVNLQNIMKQAREEFDFVVVDTLSMNEGIDAMILSKLSDGVVYITVENKTKIRELEENKIILDEAGIDVLGAVVKKSI